MNEHEYKPMNWRACLPYDTDSDGPRMLADIKVGLSTAIEAGNYQPGCVAWVRRLRSYLELGYTLTVGERAHFALVLYEAVCTEGIDPAVMGFFAQSCVSLIKKRKALPSDQLVLNWRPLSKVVLELSTPKDSSKMSMATATMTGAVGSLAMHAQRFFLPEATAEILEMLLPRLNVHDSGWFALTKGLLCMFLPTEAPPPLPASLSGSQTTPAFYWIPTIFQVWSLSRASATDASLFLELLGRLAEDNVHAMGNLGFTEEQVRHVFSAGLASLRLPVGSGTNGSAASGGSGGAAGASLMGMSGGGSHKATVDPFAAFMVWSILPPAADHNNMQVLVHLADMIQAVETYFHPSNAGKWTHMLTRLLEMLSYHFLRRVRQEATSECKTPVENRITVEMQVQFVTLLRPVVYLSLFGKDPLSVNCTHNALKYLSWIRPEVILPGLLERIYPALESLTENHRTISCIGALHYVALPLFNRAHFSQGGRHLAPLLELVLPGIDMNDPRKTVNTLLFIRHAIAGVPIVDLTKGPRHILASDCRSPPDDAEERAEDDEECRLGTAIFADWVVRFLDRIFALLENLPQEHGQSNSSKSPESSIIRMIQYTCELLFFQMSPDIHAVALRKLQKFITENVTPNATEAIGMLCAASGSAEARLAAFVPICHEIILEELDHGAGTESIASSSFPFGFAAMSDARLHWYQCILYNVVRNSGVAALKWRKEIMEVTNRSVRACKSPRGWKWAGKLVTLLMVSASSVYPTEVRSAGKAVWENEAWQQISHLYWGEATEPKELDVDWHVPTEEEKAFALELMEEYVALATEELGKLMAESAKEVQVREKRLVASDVQKWSGLLHSCVLGMTTLVTPEAGPMAFDFNLGDDDKADLDLNPSDLRQPLSCGYCFEPGTPQDVRVRTVRNEVASLLFSLSQHLRKHSEDDTLSIQTVLHCVTTLLSNRGSSRAHFEVLARVYNNTISFVSEGKHVAGKTVPRFARVLKVSLVHLLRLEYNAVCDVDRTGHLDLVHEMAKWSVGGYAVVRKDAQKGLGVVLKCFPSSVRKLVFWVAIGIVKDEGRITDQDSNAMEVDQVATGSDAIAIHSMSEAECDRLKGALYLLKSSSMMRIAMKDYQLLGALVTAMGNAYTADKKTIRARWGFVAKEILSRYQEIAIDTQISPKCVAAAEKLAGDHVVDQTKVETMKRAVADKAQHNREKYRQMVSSCLMLDIQVKYLKTDWSALQILELTEILQRPDIPLNYRSVLMTYLELTLRDDEPVPAAVTQFACSRLNSEELSLRCISLTLLCRIMYIIKRRAKNASKADGYTGTKCPSVACTKIREQKPENTGSYLESLGQEITSEEDWRRAEFVDDANVGWYCWGEKHKIRQGSADSHATGIPFNDPTSAESVAVLVAHFTNPDFWAVFFKYRTEEAPGHAINLTEAAAGIAPAERFDVVAAEFYATLFMVLGPRLLPFVQARVDGFLIPDGTVPEKSQLRAITEVVAGLLGGSKYWAWSDMQTVWRWSGDVIDKGLAAADAESFTMWPTALRYGFTQRDPRRNMPLIKRLLAATHDSTSHSFFTESKNLTVTRLILTTYSWRLNPLTTPLLLKTYLAGLRHPYEQVRQNIGANLNALLASRWVIGDRSVEESVKAALEGKTGIPVLDSSGMEVVKSVVDELGGLRAEMVLSADREAAGQGVGLEYKNAGMTVICWLYNALLSSTVASHYAYLPGVIPEILQMQVWGDQELQRSAQLASQTYANLAHPHDMVAQAVTMLLDVGTAKNVDAVAAATAVSAGATSDPVSPSPTTTTTASSTAVTTPTQIRWQIRWRVLPLLQIFYFRHLYFLDPRTSSSVVEGVASLLADPQVEVRGLASVTLAGLIRCSQREAVLRLKERFEAQLRTVGRLASKQKRREDAAATSPGQHQQQQQQQQGDVERKHQKAVTTKHAAVLGLAALVQAFPYDIPTWMPDVLVGLSRCVGDPVPIGPSVQKTFADFRRTHQDNWTEDMRSFSPDQMEALSDLLISPSYYA
ncbi:hypothetical protein HKX48_005762 [Thoreauomyces humboldtii]|nr:hypothetical protein HKX48_005762 [Thoreauomyces humboldtii]